MRGLQELRNEPYHNTRRRSHYELTIAFEKLGLIKRNLMEDGLIHFVSNL